MMNFKIILPITFVCLLIGFYFSSWNSPAKLSPEIIAESKYGIGNNATHMTGCKVLSRSTPKKIIYQPVAKRFINLPCALEVPPPFSVLAFVKRASTF